MPIKSIIFLFLGIILVGCQDELSYAPISQESHSMPAPNYDPSMLFAEWESQNAAETRSGHILYPEWYGGCFEEDGLLVIQCTDITKVDLIPEGAKYRLCKYSYNELDSISNIIRKQLMESDISCFSNVMGFGISNTLNKIQVILHDTSDTKIEKFKNEIYSEHEYVVFNTINELNCINSGNTLSPTQLSLWPKRYLSCGSQLTNPYTKYAASLGYRVKDQNGNKGFMTAGHFVYEGRYVTNADNDTIGMCKQCYRRNIMDASYCELTNEDYELTNFIQKIDTDNIQSSLSDTLSVLSVQPIKDAKVIAVGYKNTYQGKVVSHSFDFTFTDQEGRKCIYADQILLNFLSAEGNSGGVV